MVLSRVATAKPLRRQTITLIEGDQVHQHIYVLVLHQRHQEEVWPQHKWKINVYLPSWYDAINKNIHAVVLFPLYCEYLTSFMWIYVIYIPIS